jgi:hypothetical protein
MREHDGTTLSRVELQAIEVGIHDADAGWFVSDDGRSYRGRLAKLARTITGRRGRQPLADAKLELLRDFASRTHRQHRPAEQLIPKLMAHGYGAEQISSVAALAA